MEKKQVLWVSRHTMTEDQRRDLERVMGGPVELDTWSDTVRDVAELLPRLRRADAVAAVLPAEKLAERACGLTPAELEAGRLKSECGDYGLYAAMVSFLETGASKQKWEAPP